MADKYAKDTAYILHISDIWLFQKPSLLKLSLVYRVKLQENHGNVYETMRHLNTTLTTYLIPYVSNKVSLIFSTERRPGISYCRLLLHDSKTTASEHEPPKLPIVTAVWKEKVLNTFCFIAEVTVNSVTTLLIKYYRSAQIPRSPEISRLP